MTKKADNKVVAIPERTLSRLRTIRDSLQELEKQRQRLVDLYNTTGLTLMEALGLSPDKYQIDLDEGILKPRAVEDDEKEEPKVVELQNQNNGTAQS